MPSWGEVEAEAPELAALAWGFFDAHVHKAIATLRRDGSPRISATEVNFAEGEVWLGSMWQSVKALDLRRDPRFALHSGSEDPPDWKGDAKLAGHVEEVTDPERIAAINGEGAPPGPSHLFRADIAELAVVRLGDPPDHLIIESWHAGRGVERHVRRLHPMRPRYPACLAAELGRDTRARASMLTASSLSPIRDRRAK